MFLKKIDSHIDKALEEMGLESPISIQKPIVSSIKSGADTAVLSDAKTGKSTALAIACIQKLKSALNDVPRALILVKDKASADNLKEIFDTIGKNTNLRVFTVYEGPQLQKLKDQIYFGSDVVIGTPKRMAELYKNNGLNLNDLQIFALDDAPEIFFKQESVNAIDMLSEIKENAQRIVIAESINDKTKRFIERSMPRVKLVKA